MSVGVLVVISPFTFTVIISSLLPQDLLDLTDLFLIFIFHHIKLLAFSFWIENRIDPCTFVPILSTGTVYDRREFSSFMRGA
jgi:hypothetical protein